MAGGSPTTQVGSQDADCVHVVDVHHVDHVGVDMCSQTVTLVERPMPVRDRLGGQGLEVICHRFVSHLVRYSSESV